VSRGGEIGSAQTACSKPPASLEPVPRLPADPDLVTEQPGPQPEPTPGNVWTGWQPHQDVPPPPTGPWAYEPPGGRGYPPPTGGWAYEPPGGGWAYEPPGGGGYPPPAADAATWAPRRRSGRPWLIAGIVAALVAGGVIGGFAGHAIGPRTVAADTPGGSAGPGTLPGNGSGTGNGSAAGNPYGAGGTNPYGGTGNPFGGFPGAAGGGSDPSGSGQNSQGSGPSDAASIATRVDPGLVDVNTTVDYGAAQAAGTGMVLTSSGEVLTNNHVAEGATTITVTDVGNGKTYPATVVGYSVTKDVAVLQLKGASGLQTVTTAGSASVSAGEQVVGIGNAGGTGGTPSYAGGAVTATGQSITANDDLTGASEHLTGMIATNADIQAGDSGGPLVNSSGQVIGMDTAGSDTFQFASQSGTAGFAIPIATATSIAAQIAAGRASTTVHVGPTAFLGIQIGSTSGGPGSGYGYGSPATTGGVQISGTVSGSPAAGSGLTEGDVITAVAGHSVSSQASLQTVMVNDVRPGEQVTVQYTDGTGAQHSVSLVLTAGPAA
jgi:S1-C subfamily serine protease